MDRFKEFIFEESRQAYVILFVAFIAVLLMWSVVFISTIQLKIGDQVNFDLLIILNFFANGFLLFAAVALLFGVAACALAIGKWKRLVVIVLLFLMIGFCGLGAFTVGAFGTSNSYEYSTSIVYQNHVFRIVHARRSGDMIAEADYLLLQCSGSGSDCKVIERFDDYRYDASTSKPVRFYVEASDQALYIKVGDETTLVSKA